MSDGVAAASDEPKGLIDRESLCFACPRPGLVLHAGHPEFRQVLSQLFDTAESNATEQLVKLKERLCRIKREEFFCELAQGLATITGAQYAFISKRILVDDQNVAVEMPPIGEPGSCLMAVGLYMDDGKDIKQSVKNFKYHAWSCPCAYMKHDKILVIPGRLNEFIETNANDLPIPVEAYLGVPLWAEGKCFAHFGVMWSPDGAAKRNLSWGYLEMLFHSLEDMILERLLDGVKMSKEIPSPSQGSPEIRPAKVVPHEAVTLAQSLRPYARSLSHELRTPMQGVVGMLDVMYATVQEAGEGHGNGALREVFQSLKDNIEMVQDSSRRAVEAADNVVHAYDMNMGIPESPTSTPSDGETNDEAEEKPEIVVAGNHMTLGLQSHKRRRESNSWEAGGKSSKQRATTEALTSRRGLIEPTPSRSRRRKRNSDLASMASSASPASEERVSSPRKTSPAVPNFASESTVAPGLRHTSVRDVIQYVINDSLKLGGRPESAIAKETEGGEIIEVHTNSPSGSPRTKTIEWSVDCAVPQTILIDERDLAKMISCVFLNALKFTDEGRIRLKARLNTTPRHEYIVLRVEDEGPGIPADFLSHLFKPFSREDDSITRRSEGLGLGLLVARGLARKLGGDIYCVRSDTSGPNRGSEFEMQIPITPDDPVSRSGTPLPSRSPSLRPRGPQQDGEGNQANKSRAPSPMVRTDKGLCAADSPQEGMESMSLKSDPVRDAPPARPKAARSKWTSIKSITFDRELALRHPLNILVADDNMINRKLLVNMLQKLGYRNIRQAYNGVDVLRQMAIAREHQEHVDVILMDLWMPLMDGAQAARHILATQELGIKSPTILAVTADVTERAMKEAAESGMKGLMTKPFKLQDLEKLILEYCARAEHESTLRDDEDEAISAV